MATPSFGASTAATGGHPAHSMAVTTPTSRSTRRPRAEAHPARGRPHPLSRGSVPPPEADDAPVVGHAHLVAVPERRQEVEPQTLDIRRQLHGGADDGSTGRVRPEVRVIVADADLAVLPGDDERLGRLHGTQGSRVPVPPRSSSPIWTATLARLIIRRLRSRHATRALATATGEKGVLPMRAPWSGLGLGSLTVLPLGAGTVDAAIRNGNGRDPLTPERNRR